MKGLTYMVTDKGPPAWWLKTIGKEDDRCGCGSIRNAAHPDARWLGMVREKLEEIFEDEEWCRAVADFVQC